MTALHILLADDHPMMRQALKKFIAARFSKVQFTEVSDGKNALTEFGKREWDLVLLDLTLPEREGLDVLQEMKARNPRVPVLVLSGQCENEMGMRVLKSGAAGFVSKASAPEEIVTAIRKALSGNRYISLKLADKIASRFGQEQPDRPHEKLSDREYTVLKMIGSGKSVTEIGEALFLSSKTISTYRARILEKMDMTTNADLVRYAVQHRIIE